MMGFDEGCTWRSSASRRRCRRLGNLPSPPSAAAQLAEARARSGAGAGPEAQEGSIGPTSAFCNWEWLQVHQLKDERDMLKAR